MLQKTRNNDKVDVLVENKKRAAVMFVGCLVVDAGAVLIVDGSLQAHKDLKTKEKKPNEGLYFKKSR
jgi:hypothetical protein